MDANLYALETLVAERLTHARAEARRLGPGGAGAGLIALGERLRHDPVLARVGPR